MRSTGSAHGNLGVISMCGPTCAIGQAVQNGQGPGEEQLGRSLGKTEVRGWAESSPQRKVSSSGRSGIAEAKAGRLGRGE